MSLRLLCGTLVFATCASLLPGEETDRFADGRDFDFRGQGARVAQTESRSFSMLPGVIVVLMGTEEAVSSAATEAVDNLRAAGWSRVGLVQGDALTDDAADGAIFVLSLDDTHIPILKPSKHADLQAELEKAVQTAYASDIPPTEGPERKEELRRRIDAARDYRRAVKLIKSSPNEGVALLKSVAQSGQRRAQVELAKLYLSGTILPKSEAEAFRWFQQAAANGSPEAQYRAGMMYVRGEGTSQDVEEASRLIVLADQQGYSDFMTSEDINEWRAAVDASISTLEQDLDDIDEKLKKNTSDKRITYRAILQHSGLARGSNGKLRLANAELEAELRGYERRTETLVDRTDREAVLDALTRDR